MKNETLGWGLIITLIALSVLGIFKISSDSLEIILGLAIFFFGFWGGIRLVKSIDKL